MSILVPVDFSAISKRVCDVAAEAARARNASVWLIHVAQPDPDFVGFDAGPDVVRDQVAAEFRREHQQLRDLADRMSDEGVDVTPLLIQGPTVETILEQAEHHDVELIVMATHGHGVMYQMFVGSVSEGVLRRTTRPVLLVPARAHSDS
jgi:nucleotide-binding universal stress UspA family protein